MKLELTPSDVLKAQHNDVEDLMEVKLWSEK